MEISELYKIFLSSTGVCTDSRKVEKGKLFFALKGENFDGNEYARAALESGASYAVVERGSSAEGDPRAIVTDDTLRCLQELARYHREHSMVNGKPITVIGLTGTNGKTTTKELINAVLSTKYRLCATQGNLNNDVGVPLSLLKITVEDQLAVIEMGASHPEDIARLVRVCEPDYGLITNVGKAHLLGFGSFEGVKKAKGRLYDFIRETGGSVFLNTDDKILTEMAGQRGFAVADPQEPVTGAQERIRAIPYGIGQMGVTILPTDHEHPFLSFTIGGECVRTSLAGNYNVNNALAAIAVGQRFGISLKDAAKAVSDYVPSNNRSQMVRTGHNVLIVDAYNANPTSMRAALDNFSNFHAEKKALLLGSMGELGGDSVQEHGEILQILSELPVQDIRLVGGEFKKALEEYCGNPFEEKQVLKIQCENPAVSKDQTVRWYENSSSLAEALKESPLEGYAVLVKGSRSTMMEKTIASL